MAYNMRRGNNPNYANSSSNVGLRRPNNPQQLSNNFVSGGQISGQQQGGQRQQQGQQQKQQQQSQRQGQQRQAQQQQQQPQQQPQQQQQQQHIPPPFQQQQQPPTAPQQQQPPTAPQQQPQQAKIVFKGEDAPPPPPLLLDNTNGNDSEMAEAGEGNERRLRKNKPFWLRKEGVAGKINRKERLRRRNQRLRKILQPKNALMVLNELIGSAPYNMSENVDVYEGTVFKCTLLIDGVEHVGMGKSKPGAKTAAAEAALKHMVLSKLKNTQAFDSSCIAPAAAVAAAATNDNANPESGEGEVKMEIDDDNLGGISWSHVACYALHKLLSSWDEGSNLAEKLIDQSSTIATGQFEKIPINEKSNVLLQLAQAAVGGAITAPEKVKMFEKKPAKKLPENASVMNPIMLLNQMHPHAVYEEIAKSGNPPHVQFTIKCTIGGDAFLGTGSTKKGARKMCAFAACRKLLGIQYTPAFLEEHGFTEDAVSVCPPGPTAPPSVAMA